MSLTLLLGPQLRAFQAAGYEVVTASAPGPHVADLEPPGASAHRPLVHATRSMRPREDLGLARELWRLFRRAGARRSCTRTTRSPGVYGRLAPRSSRASRPS